MQLPDPMIVVLSNRGNCEVGYGRLAIGAHNPAANEHRSGAGSPWEFLWMPNTPTVEELRHYLRAVVNMVMRSTTGRRSVSSNDSGAWSHIGVALSTLAIFALIVTACGNRHDDAPAP
jgi:hypothetical protein